MSNIYFQNSLTTNNAIHWGNRFEYQKAFLAAQVEFEPLLKDANNPHFKSKYAALINVLAVASKPCLNHGITITQATTIKDNNLLIDTELTHVGATADSLGGVIYKHSFPIPANLTAQQLGSWITYMRRYVLMPIFGIAPEDDDGNAANVKTKPEKPQSRENVVYAPTAHKLINPMRIDCKTPKQTFEWYDLNKEVINASVHLPTIIDAMVQHIDDLLSAYTDKEMVNTDRELNQEFINDIECGEDLLKIYRKHYSRLNSEERRAAA